MTERLTYSIEETAELLGIGRRLAYELANRGELPALRLGKRWVVPRHRLERLLEGDAHGDDIAATDGGS